MPTYKYQAALATGVSIFGIFDAADLNSLSSYLMSRNMTLVNASELSINSALAGQQQELPRMLQLRIGDRLREALLTDMPAHEAVRAVAEEPFEHPVLMTMPWLLLISLAGALAMAILSVLIPTSQRGLLLFAGGLPVCVVFLWLMAHRWFIARPRNMLLKIASRLERGDNGTFAGLGLLPRELQTVMDSNLNSQTKATSIAELVPTISGIRMQSHQFAARLLGPVIAVSLLMVGMHVMLISIVQQFKEIFIGFGVELPGLTLFIIALSDSAAFLGLPGVFGLMIFLTLIITGFYALLILPKAAEIWEMIPGLGLSVRWLMQARVARILGVLIRNRVGPAEAVAIASKASGFQSVAETGQRVAEVIAMGTPELAYTRQLSGLPLSLLFRVSAEKDTEAIRQETAQAFQSYAAALEQASFGNGAFIALIVEIFVITSAGLMVGMMVISLFMPLIKLLNDLSIVVWWLP